MSDSLMAEVVIPFAGQRFDMELALFADVEVLIVECLRWVSEQTGLLPATPGRKTYLLRSYDRYLPEPAYTNAGGTQFSLSPFGRKEKWCLLKARRLKLFVS